MNNAVSLTNLSYSVSGLDILKALAIEIPTHSYFAIAGINGAGKSTLIKLILDLIRPLPGGEIEIFGINNQDPNCRNQLAYLPEKFDVKKNITGRQYLNFIAAVYHQNPGKHKFIELAERLDFPPDRLGSRVGEYSKGMVQKLGLGELFHARTTIVDSR